MWGLSYLLSLLSVPSSRVSNRFFLRGILVREGKLFLKSIEVDIVIERLHAALLSLEKLSLEAQEEATTYIEALVESLQLSARTSSSLELSQSQEGTWQDPFGAWSDLPDSMLEQLDGLRYTNKLLLR